MYYFLSDVGYGANTQDQIDQSDSHELEILSSIKAPLITLSAHRGLGSPGWIPGSCLPTSDMLSLAENNRCDLQMRSCWIPSQSRKHVTYEASPLYTQREGYRLWDICQGPKDSGLLTISDLFDRSPSSGSTQRKGGDIESVCMNISV